MDRDVPDFYSSAQTEYQNACERAVIIHRFNLGVLQVSGKDHTDLLHRITTNELRRLKPGGGQVNIFTNETGRIIDRVLLLKQENSTLLITSAGSAKNISEWIDKYVFIEDVHVKNNSETHGVLSIFGKNAADAIQKLGADPKLPDWHFQQINRKDKSLQIQKSAELFLPGFNIIAEKDALSALWDELLESGITPMGRQAYQSLRIESGWPEFGIDFDDSVNPHEAQMIRFVDFDKGCYIGQEVVARLDTYEKVKKYLVGLKLNSGHLPEKGAKITAQDAEIGNITSACFSYGLNQNIALAYIKTKFIEQDTNVDIHTESEVIQATQVKLPF